VSATCRLFDGDWPNGARSLLVPSRFPHHLNEMKDLSRPEGTVSSATARGETWRRSCNQWRA